MRTVTHTIIQTNRELYATQKNFVKSTRKKERCRKTEQKKLFKYIFFFMWKVWKESLIPSPIHTQKTVHVFVCQTDKKRVNGEGSTGRIQNGQNIHTIVYRQTYIALLCGTSWCSNFQVNVNTSYFYNMNEVKKKKKGEQHRKSFEQSNVTAAAAAAKQVNI